MWLVCFFQIFVGEHGVRLAPIVNFFLDAVADGVDPLRHLIGLVFVCFFSIRGDLHLIGFQPPIGNAFAGGLFAAGRVGITYTAVGCRAFEHLGVSVGGIADK